MVKNKSNQEKDTCKGGECLENLISVENFFDCLKELMENPEARSEEQDTWLTDEVIENLIRIKEQITSNRISQGMKNTTKPLGRPSNSKAITKAIELYHSGGFTVDQITKITGVSKSTLYRHINKG